MLCNAGGVIVSYFEWVQDLQSFFWTEAEVNDKLYRQLEAAYQQVLQMAQKNKLYMRDAALALGKAYSRARISARESCKTGSCAGCSQLTMRGLQCIPPCTLRGFALSHYDLIP